MPGRARVNGYTSALHQEYPGIRDPMNLRGREKVIACYLAIH